MPKQPPQWIVTASFTASGAVAYLRADQTFSTALSDAQVFESRQDAQAAQKAAAGAEHHVTDPYLAEVTPTPAGLDVWTTRERIRSQGPTIRLRRPDPAIPAR